MQIKIHGVPQFYTRGRKRMVQVTVLVGEGAEKRSETRHGEVRGTKVFGLNTDRRAVPLNEQAESDLTEAQSNLASAEATLKSLEKKLEAAEKIEPETVVDEAMIDACKMLLEDAISDAKMEVEATEATFDDATAKLAHVRRELPLEVEFVGPGLTN